MIQQRLPTMSFEEDLQESLDALRDNAPPDGQPYYGCFSGGKDSVVIKHLAKMAGVPVEWHYNVTTIDPPELVKFIKKHHPDVKWERSKYGNFFNRAAEHSGFPTRRNRWCCREYKESQVPTGSTMIMGIRSQESPNRARRGNIISSHYKTGDTVINPIFNWDASDLWAFIRAESIPYCGLYDEGFKRLGCIGCPMGGPSRLKQFKRWPKYENKWRMVFRCVWERRSGSKQRGGVAWFGDAYFDNWEEMWDWWLSDKSLPKKDDGQGEIDYD